MAPSASRSVDVQFGLLYEQFWSMRVGTDEVQIAAASDRPGMFDLKGRSKYAAWEAAGDLSKK